MATLVELLTTSETRPRVVRACAELIDAEVASKKGISGIAVKAGYRLVQAIKPTMVKDVVDKLLPEFAEALEPFYVASVEAAAAEKRPTSRALADHLVAHDGEVAEALLTVTDRRAEKASGPLLKTYRKLRSSAHDHVKAAVPGLARTVSPFV
jgi:hypothetical protein